MLKDPTAVKKREGTHTEEVILKITAEPWNPGDPHLLGGIWDHGRDLGMGTQQV